MSDQQVKEFFTSVLEGGPADRLDLDRAVAAGRRRRRIRTATTLGSAAAVLVLVGALVVSVLPDDGRADLGGATLSPTPSATAPSTTMGPDTVIEGSAEEWARALESFLPAGTQTPAVYAAGFISASIPGYGSIQAFYRVVREERPTALVVSADFTTPERRSQDELVAELKVSSSEAPLDKVETTSAPSGPVVIRFWRDGRHVSASSVRPNGVVVTVDSWNADTNRNQILDGTGEPGLIDEIDLLVTIAASVPLPASAVSSPAPIPTLETAAPDPTPPPTGTAPVPVPTPTPTLKQALKPAGLVGIRAGSSCERTFMPAYQASVQITADVLQYVVCPYENGGTLVPFSVSPQSGAVFDDLDAALRQPGQPKADACRLKLDIQRPIFVRTNDGWFKVEQPTDRCGDRQPELLDAVAAIVGTAA